jgi:hypothetical protein
MKRGGVIMEVESMPEWSGAGERLNREPRLRHRLPLNRGGNNGAGGTRARHVPRGDAARRTDPYGCCAGFSTLNTAPCGSVKTADRPTDGMSNGSTMTCPPPSAALVAVASASSTAK